MKREPGRKDSLYPRDFQKTGALKKKKMQTSTQQQQQQQNTM